MFGAGLGRYLVNSVIITAVGILLTLSICLGAAFRIVRHSTRAAGASFRILLIGLAIPIQAIIVPLYLLVYKAHLYDTLFALMLTMSAAAVPVCPPPPGGDRAQPRGLRGGKQIVRCAVVLGAQGKSVDVPLPEPRHARIRANRHGGNGGGLVKLSRHDSGTEGAREPRVTGGATHEAVIRCRCAAAMTGNLGSGRRGGRG